MRRFNIFTASHAALRSLLLDTSLLLQFTDFSDESKLQQTFEQLTELVLDCHRQAEEEYRFILPAIRLFSSKVPECFSSDHYGKHSPADKLLKRMSRIEQQRERYAQLKLTERLLSSSFRRFAEQVIVSIQMQEELLNPLLWAFYTDKELQLLQDRIESRQTISEWLSLCTWMVKDMSDDEVSRWLLTVQSTLPIPVYEQLVDRLSARLPILRWDKVQTGLTAEALVA